MQNPGKTSVLAVLPALTALGMMGQIQSWERPLKAQKSIKQHGSDIKVAHPLSKIHYLGVDPNMRLIIYFLSI